MACELNVSELMVHKYLRMRDLSPRPQARWSRPSKINPWVPLIEQWLAGKPYYSKDERELRLFKHDRAVLLPLPDKAFDPVTYERIRADK